MDPLGGTPNTPWYKELFCDSCLPRTFWDKQVRGDSLRLNPSKTRERSEGARSWKMKGDEVSVIPIGWDEGVEAVSRRGKGGDVFDI